MIRLALAAAVIVALAGCGAAGGGQGSSATATTAAPAAATTAAPATSSCVLQAADADVQVGIFQSPYSCAQWVQWLAPIGLNWAIIPSMADQYSPGYADGETMHRICILAAGNTSIIVEDAGMATYGNQICSDEEANGWAPVDTGAW